MSFLSGFSEQEIEIGINEIEQDYSHLTVLDFPERLIFITAKNNQ